MTGIYAIRNDGFAYKTLSLNKRDILRRKPEGASATLDDIMQLSLRNTAMADWWIAPETRFVTNEGVADSALPDISLWAAGAALVLSPKAKRILGEMLSEYGELLPVIDVESKDTFWIFNCLTCSDADESKSEYEFMGDTPISLLSLSLPASAESLITFKVPFEGCVTLYCNKYFRDIVNEYQMTGIRFDSNLLEPTY